MKIYKIIGCWINTQTGESRTNPNRLYLRVGTSYDEIYNWAQKNKKDFSFRYDEVFNPSEINENNVKFDFSVQELQHLYVHDIKNNEYKAKIELISRIEIKQIEIPL